MGCKCSAPIDKKDYIDSQKQNFQSYAHQQRLSVPTNKKNQSYESTDDQYSPICTDKKCKKKNRCMCKSPQNEETRKQFELSCERIKQKVKHKGCSSQELQHSKDMQQSVVVSIFDRKDREDVNTIMNGLQI